MPLINKLRNTKRVLDRGNNTPVWKGPLEDGITYSLLCKFLNCRERFRLLVIEGLKAADDFNHRLEFGSMWHVCEEAWANPVQRSLWVEHLQKYCIGLARRYPTRQEEIDKWYNICKLQFPIYTEYWSQHEDVLKRLPVLQEEKFEVLYTLPSMRKVKLRGKWDSVDILGNDKKTREVWLQENKTKGDIVPRQMIRQLTFDLQTMIYLTALQEAGNKQEIMVPYHGLSIGGVIYNVIRRPLSGGKGTIVQHKPTKSNPGGETTLDYYARLADIIRNAKGPEWGMKEDESYFFMRWKVQVSQKDIANFRKQCLDPILEQLCDWWHWQTEGIGPMHQGKRNPHWRHPYGVFSILDNGGSTEYDEYMATGNKVGLVQCSNLFPELT